MLKLLSRFRRAQTPVPEAVEVETVRDSVFSTGADMGNNKLSLFRRQQRALSRTFLRGIDSLVPVGADGQRVEGVDYAMDEAYPDLTSAKLATAYGGYIPIAQLEWFSNQGFIGWQMCGVLAQNWLIDKACGVPAQDVVRKGYEVTLNDGTKLEPEVLNAIRLADKKFNINGKLKMFIKKGRIFGIRHALFLIDGIDYEAPFNPDGITPGSYKGITQIDPYWIAPELDRAAAANPASPEFYDPTWWRVNGKRVHRSHFVIMRNGDEVVDILKPAYLYGGIGIPQKIFERVYAAERTANEAPMLTMSKRLTTFKTDISQIFGPDSNFNKQMERWAEYQNNFGIKVMGTEDEITQFETSLSELNETIMTQYGLVASAANVPVTKLMGTPPKGFDATGEYDEANYHEEIESIQDDIATPFVERHHLCLMRSYIAPKFNIAPLNTEIQWKPLDSYTTKELAEINKIKAETDTAYVTAGAIDGFDVRQRLISDPESGYNGIEPIVPDGPGDREAQQEADAALEQAVQAKPARSGGDAQDTALYAGIAYWANGKVLLMKRADGYWAFPAGTIEPGEDAQQCAAREFGEETGKKIGPNSINLAWLGEEFALFRAYGDEFVPGLNTEHTAYVWVSPDELPAPLHRDLAAQITAMVTGSGLPV